MHAGYPGLLGSGFMLCLRAVEHTVWFGMGRGHVQAVAGVAKVLQYPALDVPKS